MLRRDAAIVRGPWKQSRWSYYQRRGKHLERNIEAHRELVIACPAALLLGGCGQPLASQAFQKSRTAIKLWSF